MRYVIIPLLCNLPLAAAPFAIQTVTPPAVHCGNGCEVTIFTSGTLVGRTDDEARRILSGRTSWGLRVFDKVGDDYVELPFGFSSASAQKSSTGEYTVALKFRESQLQGKAPDSLRWSVVFLGSGEFLAKTQDPTATTIPTTIVASTKKIFTPAKARDDADIYISGSVLAGQGTKPIYMLDAKVNFAPPISKNDLRFGIYSEIQSNANATPPNNRSTIDPDSITASATLNQLRKSFYWELKPAGGEFSRKYPESNFVSSGTVAWWRDSKNVAGGWFVFYPSIGFEAGKNLNKPTILFKQPADLSRYDAIARIVPTVQAEYFVWSSKDNPKATINGSYQVRLLLADEPFTTYEYYTKPDGTRDRTQFVSMRNNARHWVNAGVTWNVSDYVGLTAQYKFGSIPPLFELVSHQVSLGVVFKSKLWERK